MSRKSVGPRAGSRTGIALQALFDIGGQAAETEWRTATARTCPFTIIQWEAAIQGLLNGAMIFQRRDRFEITDYGRTWLGVVVEAAPSAEWAVPGRYVPPMRPLSPRFMTRMPSTRDGALDYQDIPSRMGDERIAHRSKA
ncbi:MAG: hypothetical protein V4463_05310 [Pseudomonadota bacterium]